MLLWPAPATRMSNRSSLGVCWPMENGVTARGASAAVFTNPRLLILLMGTSPRNSLLRFLPYDFLDARPKVFQHHGSSISSRSAGYRSAGMCRRAGLIQTWDWHPVLRPARHRAHRSRLRRAGTACVTATMPVVRVHPLQIKRALDDSRENLVFRKVGRELLQKFQIRIRNLIFNLVPALRAFFQFVGMISDDFESVHPRGNTGRINDAATNRMDRRVFKIHRSPCIVITHPQNSISADHHPGMHR